MLVRTGFSATMQRGPETFPSSFSSGKAMPPLHQTVLILGQQKYIECRVLGVQCTVGLAVTSQRGQSDRRSQGPKK